MPAVYPVSVKNFLSKTDNIDTVWAEHVNSLQDEVTAVERTLGTDPAKWAGWPLPSFITENLAPPTRGFYAAKTYRSVTERLDVIQKQVAWLTELMIIDASDAEKGDIKPPVVIHPEQPKAKTPIAFMRASGGPVTAGHDSWTLFKWTSADIDPFRMFQGGTRIYCPMSGFWLITAYVRADPSPVRRENDFHFVHSSMELNNTEIAGQDSLSETADGTYHRMNLTWSGIWYKGDFIELQVSQHGQGTVSPSVDAWATIGFIYAREV